MIVSKSNGFFFVSSIKTDADRDRLAEMRDKYGEDRVLVRPVYTVETLVTLGDKTKKIQTVYEDVRPVNRKARREHEALTRRSNRRNRTKTEGGNT